MMKPVYPLTFKGAVLLGLTRAFFQVLGWFKGKDWKEPVPCFEEDPRYFSASDSLYLGYKYYEAPHTSSGTNGRLEKHFREQNLDFSLPAGFRVEQSLTLSAGGDLMPYAIINAQSAKHLWNEIGDWYFGADLVTANLETPIVTSRPAALVPEVMLNHMLFNGNEEQWQIFNGLGRYRGFDIVSTANNHSQDQGIDGLVATLDFLDQQKVKYTGTFRSEAERRPSLIEKNGIKIGFLAWTFSQNQFANPPAEPWRVNHLRFNRPGIDLQPLVEEVKAARAAGAEFLVLHLHAGCAYQAYPSAHIVEQYHRILALTGIDVILGGHPHNPQPMEAYSYTDPHTGRAKKSFVIYSLGDFVAYDIFTWCHLPMLLKLDIVAGQGSQGREVLLRKAEAMPVFNAYFGGSGKTSRGEIRFLPLLETGPLQDKDRERERKYLLQYWDQYLKPEA